jgi:16S rRNA (adenine1518-N6/adenine1519-N6)-dimethyltransferase
MSDPRDRAGRPRLPPIRKSLGQHFLNDRRILQRIVDALEIGPNETIVEIGPGRGSLTALLAERASRLVLVEYDRALAALLRDRYESMPSVTIVERDVLSLPLADIVDGPFKLVGNVPYYITTPILFHALVPPRPTRAVYLVQREVADRIVAKPGSKEYGALSVNVQAVARPAQLFRVPAGAFQPPPRVDSAVIRIEPRDDPAVAPNEEDAFRRLVQDAFGMRRKQLRRVLRSVANLDPVSADRVLSTAEIDPVARPETLSPDDFARLLRIIHRSPAMNSE